MDLPVHRREVLVTNPQGLHLRPADSFVRLAQKFHCQVELVKDGERVNGKSVISLLMLGAECGSVLVIETQGEDAEQALHALAELTLRNFDDVDEGAA